MIKRKYVVFELFKMFKSMVERHRGDKIKTFKTNGEGEYVSNDFGDFFNQ